MGEGDLESSFDAVTWISTSVLKTMWDVRSTLSPHVRFCS